MRVCSHLPSVPLNRYSKNVLLLDWLCGSLFTEGLTTFVNPSLPGTHSLKVSPSPFVMIVSWFISCQKHFTPQVSISSWSSRSQRKGLVYWSRDVLGMPRCTRSKTIASVRLRWRSKWQPHISRYGWMTFSITRLYWHCSSQTTRTLRLLRSRAFAFACSWGRRRSRVGTSFNHHNAKDCPLKRRLEDTKLALNFICHLRRAFASCCWQMFTFVRLQIKFISFFMVAMALLLRSKGEWLRAITGTVQEWAVEHESGISVLCAKNGRGRTRATVWYGPL